MTRVVAAVLGMSILAVACTGDGGTPAQITPTPGWQVPDAAPDGSLPVEEFNRFVEAGGQEWNRSALRTALEFLALGDEEALSTRISLRRPEAGDRARVTVTHSGLLDDSVSAVQYVVTLQQAADGTWRLGSARWAQRCQPGRGHQRFTPRPCV